MRMRKDLERKRPTRRKTEQYWTEGQFRALIDAGPAKLYSRSMIPYQVLIYLLTNKGTLHDVRELLSKRFNAPAFIEKFQTQLDHMLNNLAGLGYVTLAEDGDHVTLNDSINKLLNFRSVDPLYGAFLNDWLPRASFEEKILVLESVLQIPPVIERKVPIPPDLPKGPLQTEEMEPLMIQMGVTLAQTEPEEEEEGPAPLGGSVGATRPERGAPADVSGHAADRVRSPTRRPGAGLRAAEVDRRQCVRDSIASSTNSSRPRG